MISMQGLCVWVLAGSSALLAACSSGGAASTSSAAPNVTATQAADRELSEGEAKREYQNRCATCHGDSGKGDGPGGVALSPKPRDYTDAAWQKSVTDDHIKKTILMGGAAVGKSPNMPAAPDLESKPRVVEALVKHVRKLGG